VLQSRPTTRETQQHERGNATLSRLLFSNLNAPDRLLPRWIFLRALGLIYFSAFFSLVFQIRGLIGPNGVLPASDYLESVARSLSGMARYWYAPSLFWIFSSAHAQVAICWIGLIAAVLLIVNVWPRGMLVVCFVCFISFVAAAGDFSSYQSDGMLLEAGFISFFFAPPAFLPGFAKQSPPTRLSLFLLQWEWFRIYFESGVVKLASGDPQWRNFTAMNEYYQNGPLPTWIGWYVQHAPHSFHAFTVGATLAMELGLVWLILCPRRIRGILFCIVTVWEIGVISTANYAFLNYLVLSLGILLVDDAFLMKWIPQRWRARVAALLQPEERRPSSSMTLPSRVSRVFNAISTVLLLWVFYSTTAQLFWMFWPRAPLPKAPIIALDPFRIANRYGLFAVMTRGRYEIEFQGSNDGTQWIAYPFRYKPQAVDQKPKIFAPYQPRFDWNLWFASLGTWRDNSIVPSTEVSLLQNDRDVLSLFAGNPFPNAPPKFVRAVIWQYWFTSITEKRKTGNWWRRELLGTYAPTLTPGPDGKIAVVERPTAPGPRE
jgi:hypothetical protein